MKKLYCKIILKNILPLYSTRTTKDFSYFKLKSTVLLGFLF